MKNISDFNGWPQKGLWEGRLLESEEGKKVEGSGRGRSGALSGREGSADTSGAEKCTSGV